MKLFNLSALLVAASFAATVVHAQNNPAPTASAPAVTAPAAPGAIDGFVYVEKLPSPTQLLSDAEAEHLTVVRMEQSADRILVVYRYPNGQTRAFAFSTALPSGPAPATPAGANPQVVYTVAEPVYYYGPPRYVRYYDPVWDFWAPLSIGIGLGWGFGGYHHVHHGHGWHH